jgi:hypothetical protein
MSYNSDDDLGVKEFRGDYAQKLRLRRNTNTRLSPPVKLIKSLFSFSWILFDNKSAKHLTALYILCVVLYYIYYIKVKKIFLRAFGPGRAEVFGPVHSGTVLSLQHTYQGCSGMDFKFRNIRKRLKNRNIEFGTSKIPEFSESEFPKFRNFIKLIINCYN